MINKRLVINKNTYFIKMIFRHLDKVNIQYLYISGGKSEKGYKLFYKFL